MLPKQRIEGFLRKHLSVRLLLLVLAFITIFIWLAVFTWPDGEMHLFFFDVGQGDSIYLRTPSDYKILVDGGPDRAVLNWLSAVLPYYERDIDLLILTHPHADHVSGLVEVLSRYRVGKVVYNPVPYESAEYEKFKNRVKKLGIPREVLMRGQMIDCGDGVRLICVWPVRQETLGEYENINQASLVLKVEYGDFTALLTGDAEFEEVNALSAREWSPLQVLKVPHQGSRGAVTEDILKKLQPDLAVVSVGENDFGHPSDSEISKLRSAGSKVLRTDRHGTVEVVTDGKRWYYRSERW